MVEDQSHYILSLSRQIRELSSELDRLLILQSTRSNTSSTPSSASVTPPSTPPDLQPRSYKKEFLVGDIVRITNRYKGYRGCLASILDTSSKDTFALKLLSNGETLNQRKWNIKFVCCPSNSPS